ncbi:unnamed protein product [Parnassius apollo]|uniref:(apollo) hypothetical protein n=1 Tax=Parnassius apollo TaxID=110799 RepID=A0A8S3WM56_PARAO|nr:unnamed protein product [Parnassius apollo]
MNPQKSPPAIKVGLVSSHSDNAKCDTEVTQQRNITLQRSKRKQPEEAMKSELNDFRKEIMSFLTEFKTSQEENIKKIHDKVSSLKEQLSNLKQISDILSQDQVPIKDTLTSIHSAQQATTNTITEMQASLEFSSKRIDTLQERANCSEEKLKIQCREITEMQVILDRLSFKTQRQEQWARQLNVEVVGVPEIKNENLTNIVLSIAEKAGVVLSAGDIESCTRVQSKDPVKGRPRNIIIKMSSRIHKDNLIAGVKKHRGITTGDLGHGGELKEIFVNEHLTLDNKRFV